jgi:hypothetical protein
VAQGAPRERVRRARRAAVRSDAARWRAGGRARRLAQLPAIDAATCVPWPSAVSAASESGQYLQGLGFRV